MSVEYLKFEYVDAHLEDVKHTLRFARRVSLMNELLRIELTATFCKRAIRIITTFVVSVSVRRKSVAGENVTAPNDVVDSKILFRTLSPLAYI